ncbi:polysaccharide pyruvyl transferase family protein [Vreelandella aquamarina]|uniref:polysaccharide pyruvyl transferase family protein n=1 Tax=Vreelandella aquamarina TaxID=77097 RepID=UPI001428B67F|nr:polysaccharide pyruvyl transferase family protein [Halomonas aquamarina]
MDLKVYGARGELTKAILNNNGYDVLGVGDLGLLARGVLGVSDEFEKVHEVSFIPHHSKFDLYNEKISEDDGFNLIDMRTYDYAYVLNEIAKSKLVISESLHGLIFADSLRVPNVWFKRKDLHVGGAFKFKDYFSTVGRSSHKNVDKLSDVARCNIFDDWYSVDQGVKDTQEWLDRFVEENGTDE